MNEKREGGYTGSDSSSEEEDIEEELGYFSPLDAVNPYETFKNALTSSCRLRSFIWPALKPLRQISSTRTPQHTRPQQRRWM